jgi:hypothetical protein
MQPKNFDTFFRGKKLSINSGKKRVGTLFRAIFSLGHLVTVLKAPPVPTGFQGANPTIVAYLGTTAPLNKQNILGSVCNTQKLLLLCKNALAYCNTGAVAANALILTPVYMYNINSCRTMLYNTMRPELGSILTVSHAVIRHGATRNHVLCTYVGHDDRFQPWGR